MPVLARQNNSSLLIEENQPHKLLGMLMEELRKGAVTNYSYQKRQTNQYDRTGNIRQYPPDA
jgi:hypothetical protein